MSSNKKTKKGPQRVIGDFKAEILGPPKRTNEPANTPKRSTFDVIMGKGLPDTSQPEQMNPIVEAMLQTKESEEKAKNKAPASQLEREIEEQRQLRRKREQSWYEEQERLMSEPEEQKNADVSLPSSAPKGPGAPKGKAQGIESFKRGKKN